MAVDPKDVTDGFWYIKNPISIIGYSIVHVHQGEIDCVGTVQSFSVYQRLFDFIAPVPAPIEEDKETDAQLIKLRKDLNLPANASVTTVFRESLRLARKTIDDFKRDNP